MEEDNPNNDSLNNQDEQQQTEDKPAGAINHEATVAKKYNAKKILVVFTGFLLLVGLLFAAYTIGKNSGEQVDNNQAAVQKNINEAQNAIDDAPQELVASRTYAIGSKQVSFYDNATRSENLRLITSDSGAQELYGTDTMYNPNDSAQYYKVGKTADDYDVFYISYVVGLGDFQQYLYINEPKARTIYTALFEGGSSTITWANDLVVDTTSKNPDILAPQSAVIKDQKLTQGSFFGAQQVVFPLSESGPSYVSEEKIGEVGDWQFYRAISTDENSYQILSIIAKLNNVFSATYSLDGELSQNTDKALAITWTQGDNNSNVYEGAGAGCGSSGFMVPKNVTKDQLIKVGSSPQGQQLFQLPTSHPFVIDLYEKDYNQGEYLSDETLKNLTIDQLSQKHGYFLVENAFGDYLVMLRNDVFIRGGCAKPVVYLYPTAPTTVAVAVGADVTLSEPQYPVGGWKNVLAQPNGDLTYQEKPYGSLFWEGFGYGTYPSITQGTIVPTALALTTIRQQLYEQGLNQQETSDFIDFWSEKLPSNPFVRLTWFGNDELDALAPLYVVPKPTTSIRVFLDSEGLDTPYELPVQTFSKQPRLGFTVVEWGGLARDGSVPKN